MCLKSFDVSSSTTTIFISLLYVDTASRFFLFFLSNALVIQLTPATFLTSLRYHCRVFMFHLLFCLFVIQRAHFHSSYLILLMMSKTFVWLFTQVILFLTLLVMPSMHLSLLLCVVCSPCNILFVSVHKIKNK